MTSSCRCESIGNGRMSGVQRCFPMRRTECKPFGADDFEVADADEGEDSAQGFLLAVVRPARKPGRVKAPARRGDDHVFAPGQADRPVRRVAEGFAGDRDAVDPCLELAWDAKVI